MQVIPIILSVVGFRGLGEAAVRPNNVLLNPGAKLVDI